MAADDVRAVRQAVRMAVVRRLQQQYGGIDRAAGDNHEVRAELHGRPVDLGHDLRDRPPGRVGLEPHHVGVRQHRDVLVLQRRVDADHLRVRLRLEQARESVHPITPDAHAVPARAALRVLDEIDADREMERMQPLLVQVVAQLLDPGLVLDRREAVRRTGRTLGGVLAVAAVDPVQVLGLRVVRLEVLVPQRPGGRDAAVVPQLPEVLRPQPEQSGAVELGVPTHVVVGLRRELVAVLVVPVLRRQPMGQCAATCAGADDDHVVVLIASHLSTLGRIRARCLIRAG
jgi:hypothetical protein